MSANAAILTSVALTHGSKSKEERKQDRKEAKEKRQKIKKMKAENLGTNKGMNRIELKEVARKSYVK